MTYIESLFFIRIDIDAEKAGLGPEIVIKEIDVDVHSVEVVAEVDLHGKSNYSDLFCCFWL